jgi:hypothetical protein
MGSRVVRCFEGLSCFFGDIHAHCGASYGHGPAEDAWKNARTQLDFASVTGHAWWPDIPRDDPRLAEIVRFHDEGFERLAKGWRRFLDLAQDANDEGKFVSFPSFEWHSSAYGDHNVYYRDGEGEILRVPTLEAMREELRRLRRAGIETLAIPHHIGYLAGRRGINWDAWTPEFSPVAEIISMHGGAEAEENGVPYLHTMGPRAAGSLYQTGLLRGRVVGVCGGTDHHSAHPGSYGHGRMAVWAEALTRSAIWAAIRGRRTVALTGDNIRLLFSVNERALGAVLDAPAAVRRIAVSVFGGAPIDYVDVIRNNRILHREDLARRTRDLRPPARGNVRTRLFLECGWDGRGKQRDWDVALSLSDGRIVSVEPRFRGPEDVAPRSGGDAPDAYAFSSWKRNGPLEVAFRTRTFGNPNTSTPATQGMALEIEAPADSRVTARIGAMEEFPGRTTTCSLAELLSESFTDYLGGHASPAFRLHRAPLPEEYEWSFELEDRAPEGTDGFGGRDVYYVRVRQTNGQWAWSSPVWVPR